MLGIKEGEIYLHSKHPLWKSLGVSEDSMSEILFQDSGSYSAGEVSLVNDLKTEGALHFVLQGLGKCHCVVAPRIYSFFSPP